MFWHHVGILPEGFQGRFFDGFLNVPESPRECRGHVSAPFWQGFCRSFPDPKQNSQKSPKIRKKQILWIPMVGLGFVGYAFQIRPGWPHEAHGAYEAREACGTRGRTVGWLRLA